jgi:hypothetical protein
MIITVKSNSCGGKNGLYLKTCNEENPPDFLNILVEVII